MVYIYLSSYIHLPYLTKCNSPDNTIYSFILVCVGSCTLYIHTCNINHWAITVSPDPQLHSSNCWTGVDGYCPNFLHFLNVRSTCLGTVVKWISSHIVNTWKFSHNSSRWLVIGVTLYHTPVCAILHSLETIRKAYLLGICVMVISQQLTNLNMH